MTTGMLRVRAVLGRHFSTLVVGLLVLGVVGAWLVGAGYLFPGSHTVDRTVSSWDASGNFSHHATVHGNGTAFEPGSVVSGRTVYFESVMPVLETVHTFRYEASDGGSIDARVRTQLVIKGISGEGDNAVTYWSVSETLDTRRVTGVVPGEPVTTRVAVNVSAAMRRAREIAEELDTPTALLRARVVRNVQVGGIVNGHPVNESLTYTLPMSFRGGIYRIEAPVVPAGRFKTVEQVTVTDDPGFVAGVIGPLLFVAGIVGGGGLLVAARRGELDLTPQERTWLTYRVDRSEFDDWISRVTIPAQAMDREVMEAATLGDLVDVAIDTDEPVLEDRETGDYHVLHGGYRFTFERPSAPTSIGSTAAVEESESVSRGSAAHRTELRELPYQRLRQLAAREGVDVGASPSKADLVDTLARADIDLEDASAEVGAEDS